MGSGSGASSLPTGGGEVVMTRGWRRHGFVELDYGVSEPAGYGELAGPEDDEIEVLSSFSEGLVMKMLMKKSV
uniref:Uncharacterized protein n=1 Tax=Oryza rufipogon TaxID=4529 RepID=A0A0E0QFJ3_ORYRU